MTVLPKVQLIAGEGYSSTTDLGSGHALSSTAVSQQTVPMLDSTSCLGSGTTKVCPQYFTTKDPQMESQLRFCFFFFFNILLVLGAYFCCVTSRNSRAFLRSRWDQVQIISLTVIRKQCWQAAANCCLTPRPCDYKAMLLLSAYFISGPVVSAKQELRQNSSGQF